jgi:flagellar motor protein MotB
VGAGRSASRPISAGFVGRAKRRFKTNWTLARARSSIVLGLLMSNLSTGVVLNAASLP